MRTKLQSMLPLNCAQPHQRHPYSSSGRIPNCSAVDECSGEVHALGGLEGRGATRCAEQHSSPCPIGQVPAPQHGMPTTNRHRHRKPQFCSWGLNVPHGIGQPVPDFGSPETGTAEGKALHAFRHQLCFSRGGIFAAIGWEGALLARQCSPPRLAWGSTAHLPPVAGQDRAPGRRLTGVQAHKPHRHMHARRRLPCTMRLPSPSDDTSPGALLQLLACAATMAPKGLLAMAAVLLVVQVRWLVGRCRGDLQLRGTGLPRCLCARWRTSMALLHILAQQFVSTAYHDYHRLVWRKSVIPRSPPHERRSAPMTCLCPRAAAMR